MIGEHAGCLLITDFCSLITGPLFTFRSPNATKQSDMRTFNATMVMNESGKPAVLNTAIEDDGALLIRRYLAGEEAAFDELVTRYQPYVFNVCLQMLDNHADAEDTAQNVFVAVYKALPKFRMQSKVSTWIYRIAVNQCISWRRGRREELPIEGEIIDPHDFDDAEKRREIRHLMRKIAPHYRAVLVLKYYRELSYEEIAEVLEWSPDKVKCYLHRARNIFKKLYEAEHGGKQ